MVGDNGYVGNHAVNPLEAQKNCAIHDSPNHGWVNRKVRKPTGSRETRETMKQHPTHNKPTHTMGRIPRSHETHGLSQTPRQHDKTGRGLFYRGLNSCSTPHGSCWIIPHISLTPGANAIYKGSTPWAKPTNRGRIPLVETLIEFFT